MISVPDFGLLDEWFLLRRGTGEGSNADFDRWEIAPREPIRRKSDDFWFCFLPSLAAVNPDTLPREGNVYCYSPPPKAGSAVRGRTLSVLRKMVDKAYEDIQRLDLETEQINFLGISIGNAPPYYLASQVFNVRRIVSVVPGHDLQWCIKNSTSTRNVATEAREREYGFDDLDVFSPMNCVDGIDPSTEIEFFLGGRDRIVPYESQRKLADKVSDTIRDVKVRTYKNSGHIQTIMRFSRNGLAL